MSTDSNVFSLEIYQKSRKFRYTSLERESFKIAERYFPHDSLSLTFFAIFSFHPSLVKEDLVTFMAKLDTKSTHRNVPVHSDDRFLLGIKWQGEYSIDLALTFGFSSAPPPTPPTLTGQVSNYDPRLCISMDAL